MLGGLLLYIIENTVHRCYLKQMWLIGVLLETLHRHSQQIPTLMKSPSTTIEPNRSYYFIKLYLR